MLDGLRTLTLSAAWIARDESPHRPRAGEKVASLMAAVPARRGCCWARAQASDLSPFPEADRYVDGRGQHREVYRLLMRVVLGRAGAHVPPTLEVPEAATIDTQAMALYASHAGGQARAAVRRRAHVGGGPPAARAAARRRAPTSWSSRELVAIHGTMGVVSLGAEGLWPAVAAAARHRRRVTQPDYTTYQPWGLAAFLTEPSTRPFAEQQLHDVQTHLAVEGAGGSLIAGLLLADASAQLH